MVKLPKLRKPWWPGRVNPNLPSDITKFPMSSELRPILTTRGDVLVRGVTLPQRLAIGANTEVLTSDGTDPAWAAAAGGGKAIIQFASYATLAQGATQYYNSADKGNAENNHRFPVPFAGTLENLYVHSTTAPGVGETYTFTIMIAGAPSTITCQMAGAADDTADDAVNTEVVAAGALISLRAVSSGGAPACRIKATLSLAG